MKLGGVEVQVQVDSSPLDEYNIRCEEEDSKAGCYITSETGKQFSFSLRSDQKDNFSCAIFVDGTLSDRYTLGPNKTRVIEGLSVDESKIRPFIFSCLQLTDNDDAVTMSSGERNLENIGTLRCDMFRVIRIGDFKGSHKYEVPSLISKDVVLHEKTKKAGTHMVRLGEEKDRKEKESRISVKYIDHWSGIPYMSFTFRYRPQEMLQAQGVIPPDKVPQNKHNGKRPGPDEAGPSKRSRTEGDQEVAGSAVKREGEGEDAEIEALLTQRAALDARIREAEERSRIKREPSPIVLQVGAGGREVIDLTLD